MRKQHFAKLALTLLAGLGVFGAVTTTASAKGKSQVIDVSQYQGNINWAKTAKSTKLAIIRVRHEGQMNDSKSNQNANGATQHGVPFGQYDFTNFTSVADAKNEAKTFYRLSNSNAKFFVLDRESRAAGVKGSENAFLKAWVNQMHKLTNKKLILYSGDYFATSHHLNKNLFDGTWIAKYSANRPSFSADLWQCTASGRIAGISGAVDKSKVLNQSAVNAWLTPRVTTSSIQPRAKAKKVAKYYHSLPKSHKIRVVTKIRGYKDVNFTRKAKTSFRSGLTLKVKKVSRSKGGAYRFRLTNGQYITANKQSVKAM